MNYTLSSSLSISSTRRKKTIVMFFWISSAVFIMSLLAFYLSQTNEMSKKHSLIKYYENEIGNISNQNRGLEIAFSQNNSLRNLENTLEDSNFEKVTKIDYIRVLDTSVAAK